jgi:hypothetical protein
MSSTLFHRIVSILIFKGYTGNVNVIPCLFKPCAHTYASSDVTSLKGRYKDQGNSDDLDQQTKQYPSTADRRSEQRDRYKYRIIVLMDHHRPEDLLILGLVLLMTPIIHG